MKLNHRMLKAVVATFTFILIPSVFIFSQEKKFTLTVVVSKAPKSYLKQLDSVVINNEITKESKSYMHLSTPDSVFKIPDLSISKYRIIVYQKGWNIQFVDFAVCTSCKNKVSLRAQATTANMIFDRVFIGPNYSTGFKQLSADFSSALTKDELKLLKKSDNKLKVRLFITIDNKLSDVIFDNDELPIETKNLIRKGFDKTRSWISGIANGKPCDDFVSLSVSKLVD
jgi:hypothetical protein